MVQQPTHHRKLHKTAPTQVIYIGGIAASYTVTSHWITLTVPGTMHHKTRLEPTKLDKSNVFKRCISNGLHLVHIRKRNIQKIKIKIKQTSCKQKTRGTYMFVSDHNPIHETVDWFEPNLKPATPYFSQKITYARYSKIFP